METKKIYRSKTDVMIAGICGGIAEYFNVDSSLIRIVFVLLLLSGGSGILIYFILWFVLPLNEGREINEGIKVDEVTNEIKTKAKTMAKEIKKEIKVKKIKRFSIIGIALILIGIVSIWNQVSPLKVDWDLFWPAILILVGIVVMFRD